MSTELGMLVTLVLPAFIAMAIISWGMRQVNKVKEMEERQTSWDSTHQHVLAIGQEMKIMALKKASEPKHCDYCGRDIEKGYKGSCPGCAAVIE